MVYENEIILWTDMEAYEEKQYDVVEMFLILYYRLLLQEKNEIEVNIEEFYEWASDKNNIIINTSAFDALIIKDEDSYFINDEFELDKHFTVIKKKEADIILDKIVKSNEFDREEKNFLIFIFAYCTGMLNYMNYKQIEESYFIGGRTLLKKCGFKLNNKNLDMIKHRMSFLSSLGLLNVRYENGKYFFDK